MVWPSFFGGEVDTQWSSVQTITTSRVVFLEGLEGQSSGEVVMEATSHMLVETQVSETGREVLVEARDVLNKSSNHCNYPQNSDWV